MSEQRMTASDPEARLLETRCGPIAVSFEGPEGALPVLCVHGIPGSRRDFRYLAPLLAERLLVLRVEMPGFGESPADGRGTLSGWADVLLAVADASGARRFALLSHSFGGGAVLLAAARAGERLAGAALLATMGARRHRAFALPPGFYAAMSALLRFPLSRPVVAALGSLFYRRIRLTPPAGWRELHLHTALLASVDFAALGASARRIAAPVLLAHCDDDRLVESAIVRELAALLPHGKLLEFPTGGHHLQKTRAAELADAIAALLIPEKNSPAIAGR
jgi:pimeloyl-ACP methyl ester carboxylesterase